MMQASIATPETAGSGGWTLRARARAPEAPVLHLLGADRALPAGEFVALAPGAEAPLIPLDLPPGLKGAAREQVAQRQAIDRLGREAAELEMRPARLAGRSADWAALLVAERAAAERWRAEVAPGRSRCRAILPDYLALPAAPRLWTVATGGEAVRVRLGPDDGFSAEPPLAALALQRAVAGSAAPAAVLRLGPPDAAVDAALAALSGVPVVAAAEGLPAGMPAPAIFGHGELALDLGEDRRAQAQALRQRISGLRLPLGLAAVALLAWAAGTELETRRDLAEAAAVRAFVAEAVRRDFVPSGPLLDIPAQVTRELERRRQAATGNDEAAPSPLALLHKASAVMAEGDADIVSVMLRSDGLLSLDVIAGDFAELDYMADMLRDAGLGVRIERSSAEAPGRVNGTLVIAAGG